MLHARTDYDARIQDSDSLIPANEPVFLIRAQDPLSEIVLKNYADLHELIGGPSELADTVREHANRMALWKNKKELADAPEEVLKYR